MITVKPDDPKRRVEDADKTRKIPSAGDGKNLCKIGAAQIAAEM